MNLHHVLLRTGRYYRANGSFGTLKRILHYVKTVILPIKYVIFAVELTDFKESDPIGGNMMIERIESRDKLAPADYERLSSSWIREITQKYIDERFERGDATLWLLKVDGVIASYQWDSRRFLRHDLYLPYFPGDVCILDGFTYPEFRGRSLHRILFRHQLASLNREGFRRAIWKVASENQSSLRSMAKTGLKRIGMARKYQIFKTDIVVWDVTAPK